MHGTVDSNEVAIEKKECYNQFKKAKETGVRPER